VRESAAEATETPSPFPSFPPLRGGGEEVDRSRGTLGSKKRSTEPRLLSIFSSLLPSRRSPPVLSRTLPLPLSLSPSGGGRERGGEGKEGAPLCIDSRRANEKVRTPLFLVREEGPSSRERFL
jgi:hypothetical protein